MKIKVTLPGAKDPLKEPFYTGEDRALEFTFTEDGNPIDITGYKVQYALKKKLKDPDEDAVVFVTVTNHPDGTDGIARVDLEDAFNGINSGVYHEITQFIDDQDKCRVIYQIHRTIKKKGIDNNL